MKKGIAILIATLIGMIALVMPIDAALAEDGLLHIYFVDVGQADSTMSCVF